MIAPMLLFCAVTALETRIAAIEPGASKMEDVVRVFGEPRKQMPAGRAGQSVAAYDGFAFLIEKNVVRQIKIDTPEWRHQGGFHVGSALEDVFAQIGGPLASVKAEDRRGDPRSGVLYEGNERMPGFYQRRELGLTLLITAGRVSSIILAPKPGARLRELPRFDPDSPEPFQMDLRGADLSLLDLRGRCADLLQAIFDTRTLWPPRERMPEGFDPVRVLELGRNPGLGVRSLHKRGITGRGVGIAIVDNPTLRSHSEYASHLRAYEALGTSPDDEPQFHGSTVLSIAAGRTIGVAPEADLYFVSAWGSDLASRAQAFDRVLEMNRTLPAASRIRVISMSRGWSSQDPGAAEMDAAAKRAKDQGLLVVTSNLFQTHGVRMQGLGREPLADPDAFESYGPGQFWAKRFTGAARSDEILVPMDSRTGAGPNSASDLVFFRRGGWSWVAPYLAGVYALAAQVEPEITPERFLALALKTGRKINGLGPIVDPVALIASLK